MGQEGVVLRGCFFFWEIEERQGSEELRRTKGTQPKVQGSKVGWVVRALKYVLHGVLLLSVACTDPAVR